MSENKEENKFEHIPNASTITDDIPEAFPNVMRFLKHITQDIKIETKKVGESFEYHESVYKNKLFPCYGNYIIYFVKKYLSNKYGVPVNDHRVNHILENPQDYEIGENLRLGNAIARHYEIFKNNDTKALDILRSIKIVSLCHKIYFHDKLPEVEVHANEGNLKEIVKYLDTLNYSTVLLNTSISCTYFNADANFIFDDAVVFFVRNSMHKSLKYNVPEIRRLSFFRHIIYAFGFYIKTGKKILKYVIYNPLLGYEYTMEIKNFDFVQLEEALKKDVTNFQQYVEHLHNATKK